MNLEELKDQAKNYVGLEKFEESQEIHAKILQTYASEIQGIFEAIVAIKATGDDSVDYTDFIIATFSSAIQTYRESLINAGCDIEMYEKKFLK